jgi:hypothetical protein
MDQVAFLQALWGPSPPGFIQLWRLQGHQSFYLRAPAGAAGYPGTDIYTGVALAHKNHGRKRRCPADQAAAIPGLWADIDINGGPTRKTRAAPDIQAAIVVADSLEAPTIVINSGYGLQAWWLFREPWVFTSEQDREVAATVAAQWQLLLRQKAATIDGGFGLDATHDLARLLRLPGTLNGKGGLNAPVTVWDHQPHWRYDRQDLEAIAATAGPITRQLTTTDLVTGGAPVDIGEARTSLDTGLFNALLANSPEFSDTWHHRRAGCTRWTTSEYDLSLCSQAAQAAWTDPQLADLIVAHRARWDKDGQKAGRRKYLTDTIARARSTGERGGALAKLKALAQATKEAA